eukprot:180035_1
MDTRLPCTPSVAAILIVSLISLSSTVFLVQSNFSAYHLSLQTIQKESISFDIANYSWYQCFMNTSSKNYSDVDTQDMNKLSKMADNGAIKFYVMATYKRRPRYLNPTKCRFPWNTYLIEPDYYHFDGYSFFRPNWNCSSGPTCQRDDIVNFYTNIYSIHEENIISNKLKWIITFEDDVAFCPLTPQYILNIMKSQHNINLLHLSRGNLGSMIKATFILQFIELLKQVRDRNANATGSAGFDVMLTKLFKEKNNHFNVFYTKYNMIHHPALSLNPNAQQHHYSDDRQCYQYGRRSTYSALNWIDPKSMNLTFERL